VAGAHTVRYASRFKRGQDCRTLQFKQGTTDVTSLVAFSGREANLCLAVREYFVLQRSSSGKAKSICLSKSAGTAGLTSNVPCDATPGAGTRVERSHPDGKTWEACTLLPNLGEKSDSGFTLVSDDGIVYFGLGSGSIRSSGIPLEVNADDDPSARHARRRRDAGDALNRAFPFLARQRSDSRESEDPPRTIGTLTRSWSALSLAEKLKPLELFPIKETKPHRCQNTEHDVLTLKCKLDDVELHLVATLLESPPELIVRFSLHEKLPGVEMSDSGNTTLVRALHRLHTRQQGGSELQLLGTHRLYFSITAGTSPSRATLETIQSLRQAASPGPEVALTDTTAMVAEDSGWTQNAESRSRKMSSRSLGSEEEEIATGICEGLDEICVQCMEVVSVLSEFAGDSYSPRDRDRKCSVFSNGTLSRKLIDNLSDPISVVAGALPDWVVTAPVFAPRVFSYESRRTLLERVAFGISRSILKQQEAKVNVGRLRQRMSSLRGRAVELVGEAFSGGAEDPTALQLQADELYGMEEALAARVRASFRAAKWKEHSLEVAKAAVHRETLLLDAAAIMERYAADATANRRRLEIRFEGESGFDAASGDEAGVTRGFYADVAELLLSSETVAGVYCSSNCTEVAAAASLSKAQPMDVDEPQNEATKLPLWIPDMDSSAQVVIPTPRSDPRSALGVFPRPLPRYHPQIQEVLEKFRFMGRLFAAAMRDGFMFPLPLSSAFLKLVQNGGTTDGATFDTILTSNDLPRAGFLGGEIHAAEVHICRALDKVDATKPPRHEIQRRYEEIANDKSFARNALGKSYDCSFEDYFQDRTFVDPLDPAQDENAAPLRSKGHKSSVTVYNVREWVKLAKRFFLHDGVIAQALAFRQGVEDFFPADYLRLFTAEELQRDVFGVGDNVENWDESAVRRIFKLDGGKGAAEALVAVAAIGGEGGAALSRRFGPSSPTITFLVKALLEGSPKQRRQFLSFVTSVPIVTPGRIEVVPIVSPSGEFLPMRDPACLPRANTCARRLYLPKFDDYSSFSQVLWAVVREESKFKGFYEWRGG
jgi:HECT-domain (ubiquitin-transferase)